MLFKKDFFSLTINNNFIKVSEASYHPTGFEIHVLAKKQISHDILDDSTILNTEAFAKELKTFLGEIKPPLRTNLVLVGINEEKTFLKVVSLPTETKDVPEALSWKLEEEFFLKKEDTYFSFHELRPNTYQLVAVEKRLLGGYLDALEASNLVIVGCFPTVLPLIRLLAEPEAAIMLVTLEDNELVFLLMRSGEVLFSSTNRLEKTIQESKSEFLEMTERLLTFWRSHENGQEPLKIFVGGKEVEILKEYLGGEKLQVEVLPFPVEKTPDLGEEVHNFEKVIALSMLDLKRDAAFNLLPPDYRKKVMREKDESLLPKKPSTQIKFTEEQAFMPKRKNRKIVVGGIISFVVVLLGFLVWYFDLLPQRRLFDGLFPTQSISPLPSLTGEPSSVLLPTLTPEEEPTPEPTLEPTLEPTPELTPEPTPEPVDKGSLTIRVLNGNGVTGSAAQARVFLAEKGYNAVASENADHFNYTKTVIKIKPGNDRLLEVLKADLAERFQLDEVQSLPEDQDVDIIVIVGKS